MAGDRDPAARLSRREDCAEPLIKLGDLQLVDGRDKFRTDVSAKIIMTNPVGAATRTGVRFWLHIDLPLLGRHARRQVGDESLEIAAEDDRPGAELLGRQPPGLDHVEDRRTADAAGLDRLGDRKGNRHVCLASLAIRADARRFAGERCGQWGEITGGRDRKGRKLFPTYSFHDFVGHTSDRGFARAAGGVWIEEVADQFFDAGLRVRQAIGFVSHSDQVK